MIQTFRILGWLEGLSFLTLLLIAMPMKYMMGDPSLVKMVGMAHGLLFIGYVFLATLVAQDLKWSKKILFCAWIAAVLPLGTFVFESKYLKKSVA